MKLTKVVHQENGRSKEAHVFLNKGMLLIHAGIVAQQGKKLKVTTLNGVGIKSHIPGQIVRFAE